MLYVAGRHPAVLNRVVVGDYEDRILGKTSVAGFDVADNAVDCKVEGDKLYILLNDYKKCEHPSIAVLSHHSLEWIREISLPESTCSAPRSMMFVNQDRIVVACDAHLRDILISSGHQSSHEIVHTMVDAFGNERELPTTPVHLSMYAGHIYVMSTTSSSDTIVTRMFPANMSRRDTSFLEISFPDSVAVNSRSGVAYMLSSHVLRSIDLLTMQILFRNEVCGTTSLEFSQMSVHSAHVDDRTGFLYGTAMFHPSAGLVSIRERGLELDRLDRSWVPIRTGHMHNMFPRQGENQTMMHKMNVTIPVVVGGRGYMLMGSTLHVAYPPALFIHPLNGCSLGRAGVSTCEPCSTGREAPHEGMTECTLCVTGRYASLNETVSCEACPRGYFASEIGADECTPCSPGRYADSQQSATCETCPADHVHTLSGSSRSTDCVLCAKGKIAAPGDSVCFECPSGWRKVEANRCEACPRGKFGGRGVNPCEPCPVGKHGTQNGSFLEIVGCVDCPAGRVGLSQNLPTGAQCTLCRAGKYRGGSSPQQCDVCPIGFVSANSGSTRCETCTDGTTSDSKGVACIPCERGKVGVPATGLCAHCPLGKVSNLSGVPNATKCSLCDEGRYSAFTRCTTCPTGMYGTLSGQSSIESCMTCPTGRYGSSPDYA